MNCQLCKVVLDSKKEEPLIENRLLYSTDSFIITPCIGPINPGNVLIISKEHKENLSCMTTHQIEEIKQIKQILWGNIAKTYSDCIIAEHGAFDFQQKSGACIIHTHLHVIPDAIQSITTFDEILKYKTLLNLNEIVNVDFPYILVMTKQFIRAYYAENVPSQMIRKLIFASKGEIDNWSWRTQPKNNFNEETIKIWNHVNKQN